LIGDTLSPWLAAAPTPSGFFRAGFDRRWRPDAEQQATIVSQARLLYVMAVGYEATHAPAYLDAMVQGARFVLGHFTDRTFGGFFWSVGPDGTVLDTDKSAYGQAFAIFGLAHAARVSNMALFSDVALSNWQLLKTKIFDETGGVKSSMRRDFSKTDGANDQNPMMHLFEALLALYEATHSPAVYADARALAEFVYARMYDPNGGYVAELYGAGWRPLPSEQGGFVDVGHQFEWAFLLSRAVQQGFSRHYLAFGQRLVDFGMRAGYDPSQGGIFSRADYQGRHFGGEKGWWQQCELLRALMRYAARHDRPDLWPAFDQSLRLVREHFIDAQFRGWCGTYDAARPRTDEQCLKGSVWMVGYHAAGMYWEALSGGTSPTTPTPAAPRPGGAPPPPP
jgi:mannose/cellobiose epimerase-like protein (N-acyl-D-glucosamine 2-epimerase family)